MDAEQRRGASRYDRFAVQQLPLEAQRWVGMVEFYMETLYSGASDYSEDELREWRPGLQHLLEYAEGELEADQNDYESLRTLVTTDARELFAEDQAKQYPWYRSVSEVQQHQQAWRGRLRETLQSYLEEIAKVARDLGVQDQELLGLMRDVLADGPPEPPTRPAGPVSNVVRLRPDRAHRPPE